MKVLMFGWEYPPHILGGLGTASYGITKGLAEQGDMDITFCLPKPFGDEDKSFLNIIAMNAVPIVWRDVNYDYVNSRINALGEGGVRIYLWYELFSKIKISLPSLEEQNAIAEILNTANQEVKQYQQKLEALKLQKKGLMQQLLTGKVRTV